MGSGTGIAADHWPATDIRIFSSTEGSALDKAVWQKLLPLIKLTIEGLVDELITMGKPHSVWGQFSTRKRYYDDVLRCGVLQMATSDHVQLVRDVLVNRIAVDPPVQILLKSDPMVPYITAFVPSGNNSSNTDKYVGYLIGANDVLARYPFELVGTTQVRGGIRYRFKTCERVIGYIRQSGFHLPHLYDRTTFNKNVEWGLPEVGKTSVPSVPDAPQGSDAAPGDDAPRPTGEGEMPNRKQG
jgi:hypothetical protein